jgi:hypothetical protein
LTQSFAGCSGIGTSAYDGDEDDQCAPLHTLGWAFDVTAGKLSKTDQRDLKFVLTDLRQAGLLAYVEDDKQPTYHIVRHPDHAARFEQFFRDVMTGATPADERRVAYRISEPVVVTVTAALNDSEPDLGISRAPNVFGALTALFSRIYDYFA